MMNAIYILLIPLFLFAVYNRIKLIIADLKENNNSKLKADIFFLVLILLVRPLLFGSSQFRQVELRSKDSVRPIGYVTFAQYFLTIGIGGSITAAMVPGTNAALLGGWAITAGLGSAYGALGI